MRWKFFFNFCILFICIYLHNSPQLHAFTDTDQDLLDDAWENSHFSGLSASPDADPDSDRLTNIDEFYAGTDPNTFTSASSLSERQLLKYFQGKSFRFFWEQSKAPYYLTHDHALYNDPNNGSENFNSVAAIGFSFLAYIVADQNDWISHQDAYQRIKTALARLVELQSNQYDVIGVPPSQEGNRHGYLYHFMDNNGFRANGDIEISTIDHALLTAGALIASSYYPGTEAETLAHQLFDNTEWNWLYDGFVFHQAWKEGCAQGENCLEGGHLIAAWNRYSELMILLFQAMSASQNGVSSAAWQNLSYGDPNVIFPNEWVHLFPGNDPENLAFVPSMPNVSNVSGFTNTSGEFHFIESGSLHNHQYSHLFVDFRNRPDGYRQTNFFNNSINATMANRQYAIELNSRAFGGDPQSSDPYLVQPYETYGPDSWGLAAGIVSNGAYEVMQPILRFQSGWIFEQKKNDIELNNDSGTVALFAALGSTAFTPQESMDFGRNFLSRYQQNIPFSGYENLIGRYGLMNSFNLGRGHFRSDPPGHFAGQVIGIDLGAEIGGIENYLTGLIWKLGLRQSRITNGMANGAGFNVGTVEPFVMNFDLDNPLPHDPAWSAVAGQDPNVFGGTLNIFGTGVAQYEFIGDPRPDIPYGPQNYAVKITAANNIDSGIFITLNHHSVSQADRISFWVKANTTDQDFEVGLNDSPTDYKGVPGLEETEIKIQLKNFFSNNQIPNVWTEVRIPLSMFSKEGVRLTRLHNLSFTNLRAGGGQIWIDDIAFLGDEFKPAPPQNVQVTVQNTADVLITWNENTEADVVGYNIYRRIPGAMNFTKLNTNLIVGNNYIDVGAGYDTFEYAVTAVDNSLPIQNESDFSNVFFWTVHHQMAFVPKHNYSSAAAAKMILKYLGATPNLSEDDIYNYGHPKNFPENANLTEMDAKGVDAVLGHFDPYDVSVTDPYNEYDTLPDGNPFQGYNFGVEAWNNINDYMRDLAHWMDYPAPLYAGSNQLTNPSKVPPAVPIFGSYNNWIVVNGFSTSADPLPDESNPFYTPNFMIYGFWLTDPNTSGIGQNRFITGQEALTYFQPMSTNDIYNGKWIMVAEPPKVLSNAKVTYIQEAQNRILSRNPNQQLDLINQDWNKVIPQVVLKEEQFKQAFDQTAAESVYSVKRSDTGQIYWIVTFKKLIAKKYTISAAIMMNQNEQFQEATWLNQATAYKILSQSDAISELKKALSVQKITLKPNQIQTVSLEWKPGNKISSSPFDPYWVILVGKTQYFVKQNGQVFQSV